MVQSDRAKGQTVRGWLTKEASVDAFVERLVGAPEDDAAQERAQVAERRVGAPAALVPRVVSVRLRLAAHGVPLETSTRLSKESSLTLRVPAPSSSFLRHLQKMSCTMAALSSGKHWSTGADCCHHRLMQLRGHKSARQGKKSTRK